VSASLAPGRTVRSRADVVVERLPALDHARPIDIAERLRGLGGLVLLESARPGRAGRWSFLTAEPITVIGISDRPDPFADARGALRRLSSGVAPVLDGSTLPPFLGGLVGYLGYDLGRRLERLPELARIDQHLPDLRLALHPWTIAWDGRDGSAWIGGRALDGDTLDLARRLDRVLATLDARVPTQPVSLPEFAEHRFRSDTPRDEWIRQVETVRTAIAAGELYQANLTRRLTAPFEGDPWPLFRLLRTGEPAAFSAFIELGDGRAILSASPEPFLALDAFGRVRTDPIKGTRPRGRTREDDRRLAAELLASAKDRAENTMIVDVLRNDLGRVSLPGSVRVPRLWRLERTPSVQHLVSTVTATLRPGHDAFDLLRASFPGGSITGAPKIRAMALIESLEPVRRGPYTGALGWIGADGAMGTSILIRTLVADGRRLTLHVGGGITYRSDPEEEWTETVVKARGPLGAIGAREVEG